ncbi:MAG TPA: hypothetical protein VFO86_07395 [Terriglobia bacterium]|nr:hypothetical protein [Terriglobia bacterium]
MRVLCLILTTLFLYSSSAMASWKEYPQPQLGFVVEFPADPTTAADTYKSGLVPSAPVHLFTVKEENSVYVAAVVDLPERKEEGATLLGEAEAFFRQLGDATSVSISRVEPGRAAVFGHFLTIECRSGRPIDLIGQNAETIRAWYKSVSGAECVDHTRLVVNLFFHRGRLYLIQGLNLPTGEDTMGPSALRFANSISFFAVDGSRNFADTFR